MAITICFAVLLVSAGAVSVKSNSYTTSYSQAIVAKLPVSEAPHHHQGHTLSFLTARSEKAHANGVERRPEASFTDLIAKINRRFAVSIGVVSGALVGAAGSSVGLWHGHDALRCAAIGGFTGGVLGMLLELPHESKEVKESKEAEADSIGEKEGNTTELPEPALEKLHQLALTAVALSDYEEERAIIEGNETEKLEEQAAEQKAVGALSDIVHRINSTEKEHMVQSEGDFEDIQAVLGEGDTAEFVSAETAAANNALVTADDVARVQAGKNGSRLRGEDMGPVGDLKSFQGDMIPNSPKQMLLFQTAVAEMEQANATEGNPQGSVAAGTPWTGAKVKYCFASDVSAQVKNIFHAAAHQYQRAVPCLRFVDVGLRSGSSTSPEAQQTCNEWPAIFVQSNPAEGCYAYVGMVGWKPSQRLQLQDPGCLSIGTAIHELGHALGMAHEQARPDRDDHVRIHWNNIQYGMEHNFRVEEKAYTKSKYDALSIMHYDNFAFAVDPHRPTIESLDNHHPDLGQRVGLSSNDVEQVVAMYRGESSSCKGSDLAGIGCINKPDDYGNDVCSIDKCNSIAARHCCACGGGIQVQCYEHQVCPRTDPLPDLEAHECIEDATHLFQGQGHDCIYTNVCKFNVAFTCPDLPCEHPVRPKTYEAAQCNNRYQTQICRAPKECRVFKI